jgi:glycosyltransferase involved in cell wall biosynthesis
MTSGIVFPPINSVPQDSHRPFWSVMIPTYNGTKYLEQTLKSVLVQDPGVREMQIEVVDDCSTKDDPEELVKDIGQGRVSFFRNPQNVGLVNNWNACIRRSYGRWIHILHQDDVVLPGFYKKLEHDIAIACNDDIGAAFCRYVFMDEDGHWNNLSRLEKRKSGILDNWVQEIAVVQLIQFPSMVVKRNTYENIGGFYPPVHFAADWEMWKRIATNYSVLYEPEILACYRQHTGSESSRLIKTGANITDIIMAIEISKLYLPDTISQEVTMQAREYYAFDALNRANTLINQDNFEAAITQIKGALKCSHSFNVIKFMLGILRQNKRQLFRLLKTLDS